MHNLLPQRAIGSIRRQQTIYSIMALFFVLVLVLSSISHSPAAAQSATPVISLSASCTPDAQGSFTITNIGGADATLVALNKNTGDVLWNGKVLTDRSAFLVPPNAAFLTCAANRSSEDHLR